MVKLLRAIPKGTVDAVVSGHTHSMVHHTIEGVPVIQSGTRNVAYHMIYLQYDLKNRKVLPQNSMIDGPIPLCSRVFENQGDCNGDRPAPAHGRGKLVPAKFLGSKVEQDPETLALLEPTFKNTRAQKERVIANAVRAVEHDRRAESALGNLVTDAIREATHADFALVNPGGLRAPFEQGPITFEALFKTLPFDNMVSVVEVTGAELKRIIRIAESGSRGWFPVSGLKLKVLDLDSSARATDLNADGKTELWEVDRLIGITQFNGQAIDDQKRYRLATIDFLILGGDDMGHAFGSIPKERIHIAQGGILRDAVEAHMARLKNINSLESPLVDPRYPRLEVVKNYPSKKERQKSQKRRKKR
jgi:5'-nucleotidase